MAFPHVSQTAIIDFKNKEKFIKERFKSYTGASTEELKTKMTIRINLAADEFLKATKSELSEKNFQEAVRKGLLNFADIYYEMSSKDIDRVCQYFKELMDYVCLASSNGQLNNFRNGYNPSKIGSP